MPSTYSTNLALELIGTGDQAGVWGNTTNTNLGTLIEQAISGYVTQAVATGTDTTITIPNGATGVARNMYIELTGTGGTNTNLIVPANKKLYFIFNNSTGAVTVKVSGQTGVSVPNGKKVILVCNGTDIVNGLNYIADFGTNSFTVTNLTATSATITTLTGTSAGITTISSGSANITQLQSTSATITTLTGTSANIATLSGTTATFTSATVTNLALTSVTLSNLNIASANITTLTSSSATISTTLALSGGTANGVLYLNGSKVATSGSALTFTNPSTFVTRFNINSLVGTATYKGGIEVEEGSTSFRLYGPSDYKILETDGFSTPSNIKFYANNTEGMRLTSTGLGIGTSSPDKTGASKGLTVNGAVSSALEVAVGDSLKGGVIADANAVYFSTRAAIPAVFEINGSEKMRLDSSGNLGLGAAVQGSWGSGTTVFQLGKSTTDKGSISTEEISGDDYLSMLRYCYFDNTNWKRYGGGIPTRYYQRAGAHVWQTATSGANDTTFTWTDEMTLDASGNLGVGTSSPNILIWNKAFTINVPAGNIASEYAINGSVIGYLSADTSNFILGAYANVPLLFRTNNTTRLTIDSSGNLGLGVTPSAWWTGFDAIQLGTNAPAFLLGRTDNQSQVHLGANAFFDGTNWKYVATAAAARYQTSGAEHQWHSAASGTAGNTISFTQAMTLDASGRLLIGGTSTYDFNGQANLVVNGTSNNATITLASTGVGYIAFADGTSGADRYAGRIDYDHGSNFMAFNTSAAERARITSGGLFQVVATGSNSTFTDGGQISLKESGNSPYISWHQSTGARIGYLQMASGGNCNLWIEANQPFVFATNNAERARITSGGDLLVGKTATTAAGALISGGQIQGTVTSAASATFQSWNQATTGDNLFVDFYTEGGSGTQRGTIDYNRAGGQVRYNTTSDYRAKEVYGPVDDSGEQIDALKVYRGKMLGATQERPMMIAHEAQEVVPYAVGGEKDAVNEDGTPKYQTMDHQILVPLLIAELQSLRKRVAELEAK